MNESAVPTQTDLGSRSQEGTGAISSYSDDSGINSGEPLTSIEVDNHKTESKPFQKKTRGNVRGKHSICIGGVKLETPFKPYPSQISLMSGVIQAIKGSKNALLESPTGSGKTMALLCSSLGWSEQERETLKKKYEREIKEWEQGKELSDQDTNFANNLPEIHVSKEEPAPGPPPPPNPVPSNSKIPASHPESFKKNLQDAMFCDDDDDEFQTKDPDPNNRKRKLDEFGFHARNGNNSSANSMNYIASASVKSEPRKVRKAKPKMQTPPKIYFGTRTHKQITQVVNELKRTKYRNGRMSILSSREQSCLHPKVRKGPNKAEECRKLITQELSGGFGCNFHRNFKQLSLNRHFKRNASQATWDIEDLMSAGKKVIGCPFYAARDLAEDAEIIFCPYNYLLDPNIRKALSIDLTDEVVIFDEGHNIEDIARDASSFSATTEELHKLKENFESFESLPGYSDMPKLLVIIQNIINHADVTAEQIVLKKGSRNSRFENYNEILQGKEAILVLDKVGVTKSTLPILIESFENVCNESKSGESFGMELNTVAVSQYQALLGSLDLFFKYPTDFRVVVETQAQYTSQARFNRNGLGHAQKEMVTSFSLWCLNPAAGFHYINDVARSVILTSGTLSPLNTFASELGADFQIRREANHVVPPSQTMIRSLARGPAGHPLCATYKNVDTFNFQDEIGNIVIECCKVVPYGVLVFFPSYSMMDKLQQRWAHTGAWDVLQEIKPALTEPRKDKDKFEETMSDYFKFIDDPKIKGAVLFAVARGKISEGIDFADNYARAIISVGIPFPNWGDFQVVEKRNFNDVYKIQRGLLSGSAWYESQAFRALNQGLGRCIRHKDDWGAVIVVDSRFQSKPTYTGMLSKWVRERLRHSRSFDEILHELKEFTETQENAQ
eukprot:m.68149 g.68149  ORF g.68149 m.68149 type:complete len:899 (+) comp11944_c0_seq1:162-2858(+)